jgi:hypothetical protein
MSWISTNERLPDENELVLISNGRGWTSLGCRVWISESWYWSASVSGIYQEGINIVAECEIDDLDVKFWHELPKARYL